MLVVAGMFIVYLTAPLIPLAWLFSLHVVVGSGRWAGLPPMEMGLPLLSTAAVSLAFLAQAPRTRRAMNRMAPPGKLCALGAFILVLALAASLIWSPSALYGGQKVARLVLLDIVPAVLLYLAIATSRCTIGDFVNALRWMALGAATLGVITTFAGLSEHFLGRVSLLGTDPVRYGYIAAAGTLLWATAPRISPTKTLWLRGVPIAICTLATLGSNSKGPVLGAAIGLVLIIFRRRPMFGTRKRLAYLLTIAGAIAAFLLMPETFVSRLDPGLYLDPATEATSESVSLRERLWSHAVDEFKESPVIGHGVGSFNLTEEQLFGRGLTTGGGAVLYPHNVVLELATETGILGLLGVLLVLAGAIATVRRFIISDAALVLTVVGAAGAMFSGDISDQRILVFGLVLILLEAGVQTSFSALPSVHPGAQKQQLAS